MAKNPSQALTHGSEGVAEGKFHKRLVPCCKYLHIFGEILRPLTSIDGLSVALLNMCGKIPTSAPSVAIDSIAVTP